MLKNKLKLTLIDDYVKLIIFNNFFNNDFKNITICQQIKSMKELNCELKNTYEKLFNQLKMKDYSFLLLKQQLKLNNLLFESQVQNNFKEIDKVINKIYSAQNQILEALKFKLDKLKVRI